MKTKTELKAEIVGRIVGTITDPALISEELAERIGKFVNTLTNTIYPDFEENREFEIEQMVLDLNTQKKLAMNITDARLGLNVRVINGLKVGDCRIIADVVSKSRADLIRIRNFGKHSLCCLDRMVERLELEYNMNPEEYGFTRIQNKYPNSYGEAFKYHYELNA